MWKSYVVETGSVFFVDLHNIRWYFGTKTTLKNPAPDKNDTRIESDSKQKMMSWWNWTESSSSITNPEIEASQCPVSKYRFRLVLLRLVIMWYIYCLTHRKDTKITQQGVTKPRENCNLKEIIDYCCERHNEIYGPRWLFRNHTIL